MTIIALTLSRMIISRFVMILFGISIFVITLNCLTYVDEILAYRNNALSSLAEYGLLLAPGTLSTFLPISVLLALLLTLAELSYRNEMVAIWAAGVSPLRLMIMLLPLGIFLGAVNFAINDRAVPISAPHLQKWGIGEYSRDQLQIGKDDPIWMRAGDDILRAGSANADSSILSNVIIFRRDKQGLLQEQVTAAQARQINNYWVLTNVIVYYSSNLPPSKLDSLIYTASFKPAAAGARSGNPTEMSLTDLSYFIKNSGFGIRPSYVYKTWWQKRVSLFFNAFLMIIICIPLAMRYQRGGSVGYLFTIGVLLGFCFFIFDGISMTMGELGIILPWMAAWVPMLFFTGIGLTLTLRAEVVS